MYYDGEGWIGYWFAYYLCGPRPIYEAWKLATIDAQPSDVEGATYIAIIRLDTLITDYSYEIFGDSWVDYGTNSVYLYSF